jgi:hypothetical protein
MRLPIAAVSLRLAALCLFALPASVLAQVQAPAPVTGPAIGGALVKGEIDPAGYDFGALRYRPGQTLQFLGAQAAAQSAIAKAHGQASYQAVLQSHACLTTAERLTAAGFDSALLAPDAQSWSEQKADAETAYARFTAARETILAGQPAPYPEFAPDATIMARAASAPTPVVQALYRHHAEDQIWRHALVVGPPKSYADGVGKAGAIWLNARLTNEGCATAAANNAWLKATLNTVPWFDIKTYGKDADAAAWSLAEHADADPALQKTVLQRMGQLAVNKQSNPANFAFLWDHVALSDGRAQRYGTQMHCVGKVWAPISPVEEPAQLDERRRWVGLASEVTAQKAGARLCGG